MTFNHISVLLDETIQMLDIKKDGIYVDGTLGGGGHALEVLKRLDGGRLIGIDQDQDAVAAAGERLKDYRDKVTIVRSNYCNMQSILKGIGIDRVDGIVLDLGVSSYQLDTAERGFSYRFDAPLDMRMDQRMEMTAENIVNEYSEDELFRVIKNFGEERYAGNIARKIVSARRISPVKTTGELSDIIRSAVPAKYRYSGVNPSMRTFQAIRIELNHELKVLEDSLDEMIKLLDDRGRICIITFHSLEDRIVKTSFNRNEKPCTCPPSFPVCVCGKRSMGRVVTRKPILPSDAEHTANKRSASAKLRVFERIL